MFPECSLNVPCMFPECSLNVQTVAIVPGGEWAPRALHKATQALRLTLQVASLNPKPLKP
jgi:hypothetical protein